VVGISAGPAEAPPSLSAGAKKPSSGGPIIGDRSAPWRFKPSASIPSPF
jgi:hypothetical protein